jgi:predicted nucleic acid-binding protein
VTLVLDAAPLVALADREDPRREAVKRALERERGGLVLPAPVSAEVDYLLGRRIGPASQQLFLEDLAAGAFSLECLDADELESVAALNRAYQGLRPGLADLSIVALAQRFDTRRLLTFDDRHFRAIRPLQGGAFRLLPADA